MVTHICVYMIERTPNVSMSYILSNYVSRCPVSVLCLCPVSVLYLCPVSVLYLCPVSVSVLLSCWVSFSNTIYD